MPFTRRHAHGQPAREPGLRTRIRAAYPSCKVHSVLERMVGGYEFLDGI
jgi:hypothetical protein